MDTKYWKAVCDERSIGGSGEYCGDNDAHFNRLNVLSLSRSLWRQVRRGQPREPYARA
jgi:hypothetical protein